VLTLLAAIGVLAVPIVPVAALLVWAEWRDRRRATLVTRQIELTDAISAELGAVVAPVLRRAPRGGWRVDMTVPPGRPALVGRVLEITQEVLPERHEIRLVPRMAPLPWRSAPARATFRRGPARGTV
jgi:hypothetical protein